MKCVIPEGCNCIYTISNKELNEIAKRAIDKKTLMIKDDDNANCFLILKFPKYITEVQVEISSNKEQFLKVKNKYKRNTKILIWTQKSDDTVIKVAGKLLKPYQDITLDSNKLRDQLIFHINDKAKLVGLKTF